MKAHDIEDLPPDEKNPPPDSEAEKKDAIPSLDESAQTDIDDFLQMLQVF